LEIVIPAAVSLFASLLTLFSGFGLGTLLLPAFALFFPVELAVVMTAIVHFANNCFKLLLLGRFANRMVILKFGLPAIAAAFLGSSVLSWLSSSASLFIYQYHVFGKVAEMSVLKLTFALLIIVFVGLEFSDLEHRFTFEQKYLVVGGLLSGFFGGLSGHQGALRTMFLLRCGLEKHAFLATGIAIAFMIDVSRLLVYQHHFAMALLSENLLVLSLCILAAFLGAFVGARLVKKVTMRGVQKLVATMLIFIAVMLGAGWI
jgi:uncharacterized membrane protein YfcA